MTASLRIAVSCLTLIGASGPCGAEVAEGEIASCGLPRARSVEQLPVDRFDLYVPGKLPPYPWEAFGDLEPESVHFSLEASGESPFKGNEVTGKGLLMQVDDPGTGQGCGIRYRFAPPPEGPLYLGFDFRLGVEGDPSQALGFDVELTDCEGKGVIVSVHQSGRMQIGSIGEVLRDLTTVDPGVWYHVALNFREGGGLDVALTDERKRKETVGGAFDLGVIKTDRFQSLTVTNANDDDAWGSWVLDNILMAGKVDASRAEWFPFERGNVREMEETKAKKVFAYYYEIYTSGYNDEDPGLGYYTLKTFNPSKTPQSRIESGTEYLARPLPRAPMEPGLDADEVLIRAMEEEVRLAIQMGLDGFLLDFFALPEVYSNPAGQRMYNRRSFALMDAAKRVDPQFKIIPAVYAGWVPEKNPGPTWELQEQWANDYGDSPVLHRILQHPQVYRLEDGRVLFSKWGTELYTPEWWAHAMRRLESHGFEVALLGQFNGLSRERLQAYAPVSYGMSDWGPRSPVSYDWPDKVRDITELVVAPAVFQDVRTRGSSYWEACNSGALRNMWESAIENDSDWIFIHTWSDYSEQAQAPSTAFGYAIYDLNAYYTKWFKSGQEPEVVRDTLYYFHRINHSEVESLRGPQWTLRKDGQGFETRNEIELLAFLEEPGQIGIRIGETWHTMDADAGMTSLTVPFEPGQAFTPEFRLMRQGESIVSELGRYTVLPEIEYGNMLYHGGVIVP
ncbi:hypothetical protein J3R74_001817 [Puniceicoccus vermicola]|uniref:Glycosyl hydrolase family 71 n=2 Tax=Puniceicoccus vermicola TaxID=388746 RepID=A0A7X1AZ98_9BACT|nr:endo-1,3-alpha-glucanase family glycosylhydrolase [Puniceicoccus vermicola]MBC2602657.1 hypothetical protein [Puniceicoccus vermicola]